MRVLHLLTVAVVRSFKQNKSDLILKMLITLIQFSLILSFYTPSLPPPHTHAQTHTHIHTHTHTHTHKHIHLTQQNHKLFQIISGGYW